MELLLKTNNQNSIIKIIALAKKLNVTIEEHGLITVNKLEKEELINRILNHKANGDSTFEDAAEWQRKERKNNDLPFSL